MTKTIKIIITSIGRCQPRKKTFTEENGNDLFDLFRHITIETQRKSVSEIKIEKVCVRG